MPDSRQAQHPLRWLASRPAFWVTVATLLTCVVMSFLSDPFLTERNLFTVTRHFAFIGIMALGMHAVAITGAIALSLGPVMGLAGALPGLMMGRGYELGEIGRGWGGGKG